MRAGQRQGKTSDGPNGAAVDDELGTVDRGRAMGGQVGDEVCDLIRLGRAPDRDSTKTVKDDLPRLLDRAAICGLQTLEQIDQRFGHDPAGGNDVDPHALRPQFLGDGLAVGPQRAWRWRRRWSPREAAGPTGWK